jgi:hypothetical protein
MGKFKEQDIEKRNYIQQNFSKLIADLSFNSARDEMQNNSDSFIDDDDIYDYSGIYEENTDNKPIEIHYNKEFQILYNRWVEYYESKFYEFIEVPVINDNEYILVRWPESQKYMTNKKASLADSDMFGSSAYFIPKKYLK